jgi:hypothetical protein
VLEKISLRPYAAMHAERIPREIVPGEKRYQNPPQIERTSEWMSGNRFRRMSRRIGPAVNDGPVPGKAV